MSRYTKIPVNVVAVIKTLTVGQILHVLEPIIEDIGHLDLGEAEVRPVLDPAIIIESVEDRVHKVTHLKSQHLIINRRGWCPRTGKRAVVNRVDILG